MLDFFRKYQKFFFFVVAIVTIISFTFFGTYNVMTKSGAGEEAQDRVIGKAIDGSSLSEREVMGMVHFLDRSPILTDNLIEKDFIATGLTDLLVELYFKEMKDDLEVRRKKAVNFRPYAHPQAAFLNAEAVWEHFSPQIVRDLKQMKLKTENASPEEIFALLSRLYVAQANFSPDTLKRVLYYQQNQFSGMPQDPHLMEADLSLFGFKSVQDWFGSQFSTILSEFIINAAHYAKQKGYEVSKEEAFGDLLQNIYQSLQVAMQGQTLTYQDAENYLNHELRLAGLDQNKGIELWRNVLLFRRLFDEAGGSVFLDSLFQGNFNAFAHEKASVDLYQLPPELRLKDFRSLLKFQVYLEAVAPKTQSLALPTAFFTPDEIEKRTPELVQRKCNLEVSEVSKEQLLQQITLKQTWDWELDEKNWQLLRREFPALSAGAQTREERFAALEGVEENLRQKMDKFAQNKILDAQPDLIKDALQKVTPRKMMIGNSGLEGVVRADEFYTLIQNAPIRATAQELSADLECFSQDNEHFYRIWVLEKPSEKEVLTFKEAQDVLETLLDKRLEQAYSENRKKDPSEKPFNEVKDQVGAKLYASLLKKIDKEEHPLDYYANHRLSQHLSDAKASLAHLADDPRWVRQDQETGLASQWKLIKKKEEFKRSAAQTPEEAFKMKEGEFSSIAVGSRGDIFFFKLLERKVDTADLASQVEEEKNLISNEARRALMRQLLSLISEKQAIDLTAFNEVKP